MFSIRILANDNIINFEHNYSSLAQAWLILPIIILEYSEQYQGCLIQIVDTHSTVRVQEKIPFLDK